MKATKRMKFVLAALTACVVCLSGLSGASPAEAGVKLDDIQVLLRWKDDRKPTEPPAPAPRVQERHEAHGPHWEPRPGGHNPHGPRGPVHAPHAPRGPRYGFHDAPKRPGHHGRDVPPPSRPAHGLPHPGTRR